MEFVSINQQARECFQRQGAICLRGQFTDWLDVLRAGVQRNYDAPGPYFSQNNTATDTGSFWDDYCNWQRIAEYEQFVRESSMARYAAEVMNSTTAQLFHDHVLVKEPGSNKPTPWHQDAPYYFVDGTQTVSFWVALDDVAIEHTLKLIAGSNHWPKLVKPVKWIDDSSFYINQQDAYMALPDIDANPQDYTVLRWAMQPGDAVLFDYRCVHGANGNHSEKRRRAFSVRWVGDDARYIERPGRTSPPFPGHNMVTGQRLREDWFPVIWPATTD